MTNPTINLSKDLRRIAGNLDKQIELAAGEKTAFTLLVHTPDRASYISNCDRADSMRALRGLLELWDQNMPDIEAHNVS